MAESSGYAIVGMAAVFPGARDLQAYWDLVRTGADAIAEVPATRWDPVYFDPTASAADRFYCRRGGFVDGLATIDPIAFGLMPVAAAAAEPDQMLALHVAARAIDDAGGIAPGRAGVILGRGGYLTPGVARLSDRVRSAQQIVTTLAELVPDLDASTLERVRRAFQAQAGDPGPDAAAGLVPNLAASRIANRLDLRGPAYTVDAACASALVAVDQACRELASGRCDVMLAGGVHLCHDVTLWSVFTQLGAMSRAQAIRPFDRRADGLLVGEGAGIVVLKRLADARRDGDRVYAVIRGTGVSSDGRESSPLRPRAEGQVAAIQAAWHGLDPDTVGLLEAHGTATPVGDDTELDALARCFGTTTGERAVIGSVKSQIGHAMPAAGAAGLIKAALALHHGVLPPTLHCEDPHEGLARTRFRTIAAAEPWGALARRAGVSAFGFGGINAHVVLDAADAPRRRTVRRDALVLAAPTVDALRAALDGPSGGAGPVRLVVLDPTPERRALARKVVDRGRPWRGQHDVWFTPHGLADGGKLALLFPGLEAAFAPDTGDLGAVPDAIAVACEHPDAERRSHGVFELGRLLASALHRAGVRPDAAAGHSVGEWTAMVATEMIPSHALDAFRATLPAHLDVPDVVFAAAGCGATDAQTALDGLDATVSHDNCPHQSVLCGTSDAIAVAMGRLRARGVLCQELPFKSGFHSPRFAEHLAPHRERVARLPLQRPHVPLWSATTCAPYPDDAPGVRALIIDHLVRPVRFGPLVERLYAEGVRGFVQVGVGSLPGFIGDTLRGRDHVAIAAASPTPGQLARVGAALFVEGWSVDLAALGLVRTGTALRLGAPLVRLGDAVPPIAPAPLQDVAGSPILAELAATLREAAEASRAVADAWRAAGPRTTTRRLSVQDEPGLLDHCFYRQPPGWPAVADRYPVVPMTMMIAMMIEAARAPGRVAVAVEDVRAWRWLAVAPPVDVTIRAEARGDRVQVAIDGYAEATVVLAPAFPQAPAPALPVLTAPRAARITPERLYADRWMFHGPRYAGVVGLGPVGDDGVDGTIEVLPAPGALLDCAGQLMGWWVMDREVRDRLAMPVRIERIALFGDEPPAGARVACRVRVREVGEREVRADMELISDGRLWARIDGWEDRRFDSDDVVWDALRFPETHPLGLVRDGAVVVTERWHATASRDLIMRRYLNEAERAAYDALDPRERRAWLLARIAIKDAVRHHRWAAGAGPIFPVEIAVAEGPDGPVAGGMPVTVAARDDVAVARIGRDVVAHPAESTP